MSETSIASDCGEQEISAGQSSLSDQVTTNHSSVFTETTNHSSVFTETTNHSSVFTGTTNHSSVYSQVSSDDSGGVCPGSSSVRNTHRQVTTNQRSVFILSDQSQCCIPGRQSHCSSTSLSILNHQSASWTCPGAP